VYPTPASSDLTIDVKGLGTDELRWTLTNILGEVLMTGVDGADATGSLIRTIDVTRLSAGTYTLTAAARGEVDHIPFVIQR
jgi:hypothetical protein